MVVRNPSNSLEICQIAYIIKTFSFRVQMHTDIILLDNSNIYERFIHYKTLRSDVLDHDEHDEMNKKPGILDYLSVDELNAK